MRFDDWSSEVRKRVGENGSGVNPDDLDPDAMYLAFAGGVSPQAFASATLPLRERPAEAPSPEPGRVCPLSSAPASTPVASSPLGASEAPARKGSNLWPVGLGVVAFFWVVLAIPRDGETVPEATSQPVVPVQTKAVVRPKPPTDAQKVARAKLALATWTGKDDVYVSSVTMLSQVSKMSASRREAQRLLARWKERKGRADARKAEAERLAAAKANRQARAAALLALRQEREGAKTFTGDGDAKVAIGRVELHRSTESHYARGSSTFVFLSVGVLNTGGDTIHANPNDFTLADSEGNTVSPDVDTYGLSNHFDAVNLSPGQQTSGWLVFYLQKDKRYTLTRTGGFSGADVTKPVIP